MPYTTPKQRNELEKECETDRLADYLASNDLEVYAGNVNYLNFKIAKRRLGKKKSYFTFVVVIGTLFLSILEIARRFLFDYENKKIKENGDVE